MIILHYLQSQTAVLNTYTSQQILLTNLHLHVHTNVSKLYTKLYIDSRASQLVCAIYLPYCNVNCQCNVSEYRKIIGRNYSYAAPITVNTKTGYRGLKFNYNNEL